MPLVAHCARDKWCSMLARMRRGLMASQYCPWATNAHTASAANWGDAWAHMKPYTSPSLSPAASRSPSPSRANTPAVTTTVNPTSPVATSPLALPRPVTAELPLSIESAFPAPSKEDSPRHHSICGDSPRTETSLFHAVGSLDEAPSAGGLGALPCYLILHVARLLPVEVLLSLIMTSRALLLPLTTREVAHTDLTLTLALAVQ